MSVSRSQRLRRHAPAVRLLCARLPTAALVLDGGRVRCLNGRARALLGVDGATLDAAIWSSLLAVVRSPDTGPRAGTARMVRADGELRTIQVSVAPLREAGPRAEIWLLHDVTEHSGPQAQLRRSNDRLAHLSAAVDAEQQYRRRQAAQRLHDEVQQPLAAIGLNLEAAARTIAAAPDEAAALLARTAGIAADAIAASREIVDDLGSPMLAELGLAAALDALVGDFGRRHRIRAVFRSRGVVPAEGAVPAAAAQCCYRVAEEALANVARHARARQVRVWLAGDRRGGLALTVRDDGVGLAETARDDPRSLGLQVIEQRVRAVGGTLVVRGAPGLGTRLAARLPQGDGHRPAPDPVRDTPEAALLRFFYRAPVGLVQTDLDGAVQLLNPRAAGWLLPFSPDGRLDNLFTVLAAAVPGLAARASSVTGPDGVLCDGVRLERAGARPLSLTLTKQSGARWMAALSASADGTPAASARHPPDRPQTTDPAATAAWPGSPPEKCGRGT